MQIRLFEVRDRATFIPVMAVKIGGEEAGSQEDWLLRKCGFGQDPMERDYVILTHLQEGSSTYDPYEWGSCCRTMREAHIYIQKNFDSMVAGDVVDVEYILGEVPVAKLTERYY